MPDGNRKKRMETGPDSAGQSGAIQQISDTPIADSESVEELAEEGNAFEADAIYGVENATDPDAAEVTTRITEIVRMISFGCAACCSIGM